jgi:osmotically-inducible protein OsmY
MKETLMTRASTRNRTTLFAAILAGAALAAAGCSDQNPAETAGRKIDRSAEQVAAATDRATAKAAAAVDDSVITTKVKTAVLAEPGLKSLQIDVDTKNGVVTLSGTVDNAAMKDRAYQIAQNVTGVRSVVDNLAVKTSG